MRYALIRDGIVENVIELAEGAAWEPPTGTVLQAIAEGAVSPGWTFADGVFADPAPPPPAPSPVPPSIPNWKAHAILKIDGTHQAVVDVIAALPDAATRELVQIAFERLDPIPRDSSTLASLLTAAGYDAAGIDDLFVRGNALQIDAG